jgi:hypothetical protein
MKRAMADEGCRVPGGSAQVGYVMPLVALLLIPLMVFAAFVVDVGGWYARGGQLQRAADAAALAGVVWLPDETKARATALEIAARNGFEHGGDTTVSVTVEGAQTLRVAITARGEVFFGKVISGPIGITRSAAAKYVLPVPMGSPRNVLGIFGHSMGGATFDNPDWFGLSVFGECYNRAKGDMIGARYSGVEPTPPGGFSASCGQTPKSPNPRYSPERYQYIITLPEDLAEPVDIRIFDPGRCAEGPSAPLLTWRLYKPDDTPLDDDDNNEQYGPARTGTACMAWETLWNIPAGEDRGRWIMRLDPPLAGTSRYNAHALWVKRASDTRECSGLHDPLCPSLSARQWLGIAIHDTPNTEFYLADVAADHAGKTMVITMFDPGEGMNNIQILDPDGVPQQLRYRTTDCGSYPWFCSPTATGYTTDVPPSADTCLHGGLWVSCVQVHTPWKRFNNRTLEITLDIPPSYDPTGPEQGWWKVRYTPTEGFPVGDWTTWGVRIIGDPVRIVD